MKTFKQLAEAEVTADKRADKLMADLKKVGMRNGNFVDDGDGDMLRIIYLKNSVPNIVTPKMMDKLSDIVKKHDASVAWNTSDGTMIFMLTR